MDMYKGGCLLWSTLSMLQSRGLHRSTWFLITKIRLGFGGSDLDEILIQLGSCRVLLNSCRWVCMSMYTLVLIITGDFFFYTRPTVWIVKCRFISGLILPVIVFSLYFGLFRWSAFCIRSNYPWFYSGLYCHFSLFFINSGTLSLATAVIFYKFPYCRCMAG